MLIQLISSKFQLSEEENKSLESWFSSSESWNLLDITLTISSASSPATVKSTTINCDTHV